MNSTIKRQTTIAPQWSDDRLDAVVRDIREAVHSTTSLWPWATKLLDEGLKAQIVDCYTSRTPILALEIPPQCTQDDLGLEALLVLPGIPWDDDDDLTTNATAAS